MSEKSIWLARHGQTEWNKEERYQGRKNSPLTTAGKDQAELVGRLLLDKNIEQILVSPLGRARETAAIISNILGREAMVMEELAEMNFGLFEGKTKSETRITHPDFYSSRESSEQKISLAYPDGESYLDVWDRLALPILSLMSRKGEILLIAHNSVNKVIRGILLGQELKQVVSHDQKNNQVIQIFPAIGEERVHHV